MQRCSSLQRPHDVNCLRTQQPRARQPLSTPEQAADMDDAGMATHTATSSLQPLSAPKRAADVDDADTTTDTASYNKRLRPLQISSCSSTLVEDMQRLLETAPSQIRFDESGSLITICAQEKTIVSTMNRTIWRKAKLL